MIKTSFSFLYSSYSKIWLHIKIVYEVLEKLYCLGSIPRGCDISTLKMLMPRLHMDIIIKTKDHTVILIYS